MIIYFSAKHGDAQVVENILHYWDLDVNVESENHNGHALFLAAHHGHLEVVKELLKVPGVDVNKPNYDGVTRIIFLLLNKLIQK